MCFMCFTWHLRGLTTEWSTVRVLKKKKKKYYFGISLLDRMQMPVISYFNSRNNWFIWPLFLSIVGSYLLFRMPFAFIKRCFSSLQAALLTKLTFYARISSESLAPLWFNDVVHNAERWILKARVGKKFCRVRLKLKKTKTSGWMAFQTVSATQKWSTNGGQMTAIM